MRICSHIVWRITVSSRSGKVRSHNEEFEWDADVSDTIRISRIFDRATEGGSLSLRSLHINFYSHQLD